MTRGTFRLRTTNIAKLFIIPVEAIMLTLYVHMVCSGDLLRKLQGPLSSTHDA